MKYLFLFIGLVLSVPAALFAKKVGFAEVAPFAWVCVIVLFVMSVIFVIKDVKSSGKTPAPTNPDGSGYKRGEGLKLR